ncbi:polysaccharide deacetylase family protein [Streptomyces boncukensis]|uniref:Polysaccharide deacetylase family protein n=1 Tax=Streptomyces boncukensis TaxID=2711219 RepID=A0A6G4X4E5_9ACTN|nr:polysaccharide deacetylase family protein [Streptomyces boncukensis]NGO72409.1 polysaccharide deacetylase family protein [Streptomyces boncukensis]
MYHAIAEHPARPVRALSVAPRAFRDQMALLADHGFTPLTTRELGDAWRTGSPLPPRPVVLTFDDGYAGVHTHALAALAEHRFHASLFVSTGWLPGPHHTGGELDTMLTWEQVRELADAGMEIGGHSHTHPQLDQLPDATLQYEIAHCRDLIAAETGTVPVSFAYPFGYSSSRVRRAVRDSGYGLALAVNNALAHTRQSPYALTRLTVRRGTDLAEFTRLIEGQALGRSFARDRALGKGYAVVRRARQAYRTALNGTDARGSRTP